MNTTNTSKRIGFGPRLGAFLIDSFILAFLVSLLVSIFMPEHMNLFARGQYLEVLTGAGGPPSEEVMQSVWRVSTFMAHISMLYMLIEGFTGATPGKKILGLKIGRPDGSHGDQGLYLTRYMVKNSPSLLNLLVTTLGIGLLGRLAGIAGMVIFFGAFMMLSPERQALHDRIAHTAVFRRRDLHA
ncbi:MAG TPA: RDD family protein [Candidatus Aminicenantes bacterium]|nr:RDD family protein [Candidatus Aminicenantes bacterium]